MAKDLDGKLGNEQDRGEEKRLHLRLEQHRREMKEVWDRKRQAEKGGQDLGRSTAQDDSGATGLVWGVLLSAALTFLV